MMDISPGRSVDDTRPAPRLVLASGSPRRKELLETIGVKFEIISSDIDESVSITDPKEVVEQLALAKARAVAETLVGQQRAVVLGADTLVILDDRILGKPESRASAFEMLKSLSGRAHKVYTGVAVVEADENFGPASNSEAIHCVSTVVFREIADAEIQYYVATDEPMDKAGAYALQGMASAFVAKVDGCYTNIIGLPVPDTISLLRRHDVRVLGLP